MSITPIKIKEKKKLTKLTISTEDKPQMKLAKSTLPTPSNISQEDVSKALEEIIEGYKRQVQETRKRLEQQTRKAIEDEIHSRGLSKGTT